MTLLTLSIDVNVKMIGERSIMGKTPHNISFLNTCSCVPVGRRQLLPSVPRSLSDIRDIAKMPLMLLFYSFTQVLAILLLG